MSIVINVPFVVSKSNYNIKMLVIKNFHQSVAFKSCFKGSNVEIIAAQSLGITYSHAPSDFDSLSVGRAYISAFLNSP
jgi:hypothetical protein